MKGGFMNFFRGRRIFRLLLAVGSLLLLLGSLRARGDASCVGGTNCEEARPLDRDFVSRLVGQPKGPPLEGAELLRRTHEVGLLLRCPTCQGSSVSDSPSSTALNMRQEVSDLLEAGYAEDQILAYFEAAYGQFVLLQPKPEGFTLLVWLAPAAFLFLGGAFLVAYFRKAPAAAEVPSRGEEDLPGRAALPEDEELARWVKEVRELAYGWPGGEPPAGRGET